MAWFRFLRILLGVGLKGHQKPKGIDGTRFGVGFGGVPYFKTHPNLSYSRWGPSKSD